MHTYAATSNSDIGSTLISGSIDIFVRPAKTKSVNLLGCSCPLYVIMFLCHSSIIAYDTHRCHLTAAIDYVAYLTAAYVDIGSLAHATCKLHRSEVIRMIYVCIASLFFRLLDCYSCDCSMVVTSVTASKYILEYGASSYIDSRCITHSTQLTAAIDILLYECVAAYGHLCGLGLSHLGPDWVDGAIKQG